MSRRALIFVNSLLLIPFLRGLAPADGMPFVAAGEAYAPLDVSKHDASLTPLTASQRRELLGEFKGLVHLGLRQVSYDRWEGRDMADCTPPASSGDRWSLKCEVITGQGDGMYYFYPSQARRTATLQHMDIRVDAADEKLLDDFRRPVQEFLGKASFVEKPSVQAKASGLIRRWSAGDDTAELFIDHSSRPQGAVRFVWMRSLLAAGAQAWLKDFSKGN
jgi:hypothetical protein